MRLIKLFLLPVLIVTAVCNLWAQSNVPLTFEAIEAGAQVTFRLKSEVTDVEYSTDGSAWNAYTSETPITLANVGDKVSFRGNNERYGTSQSSTSSCFSCSADCYIYGNIMSLINSTDYESLTSFSSVKWNTLSYLFYNNTHIKNHANKSLVLPATTLTSECYYGMFYGCSGLTSAPELPATTLASDCYKQMFSECTSLTQAPALPATTLTSGCYSSMFTHCSSLTTAPELPATTLANYCYSGMFYQCTNLNSAPELPVTTLARSCYSSMFGSCTSLTTAPSLPATTMARNCYDGMFWGCTLLTSAPDLPATTLAEGCYANMFANCSHLTSPPVISATTLANACCQQMFMGCTSLTSAPALPATTLAAGCYQCMFAYCTQLASTPSLPATTLTNFCYEGMFEGCMFTSAPELPATTLAKRCYSSMFKDCTNLTSAPELSATILAESCYWQMFLGCTSLSQVTCLATDISATSCTLNWLGNVASSGTLISPAETAWETNSPSGIPTGWNRQEYQEDLSSVPLTFEAIEAGAQVTFKLKSGVTGVEYSTDGSTWNSYTSETPITLANIGDKVSFRGDNAAYGVYSNTSSSIISCSADCYVYGNIMSLINSTDYETTTTLTTLYAFGYLFYQNTHIKNHATKSLILPATTLYERCYYSMFAGCTGLTSAPELPATTLAISCYESMFANCSQLTSTPELPATTLADRCYAGMFSRCSSLTAAPTLPATILAQGCYSAMFNQCSNLVTAPELPATTLASSCYYQMFNECTSLTAAPALPATTLAVSCYCAMFSNCTSLTSAPELPATTLANYCYNAMFRSCRNLSSAPDVLPATTLAYSCYQGMFSYCNLTTTPELPATTLANKCYQEMFSNCTNLTSATELPATTLAEDCYNSMFQNCTHLISAPALPATDLAASCYKYMFYECTTLTTAPELPAMTLVTDCYRNMFYNCSQINQVSCLATDISASDCTQNWLNNVASTGTFIAPAETAWQTNSASGIPTGWNRQDYQQTEVLSANEAPDEPGAYYTTFYHSTNKYQLPNDGTEAYAAVLNNNALDLTKIAEADDILPANVAVILRSNSGSITLTQSDAAPITLSVSNSLQGVDVVTDITDVVTGTCYVLSGRSTDNSVQGIGFYLYEAPNQLMAHKAYVDMPVVASSPAPLRLPFRRNTQQTTIQMDSTVTICSGDTCNWRGVDYTQAGVYSDTVSVSGRDTIYTLTLTVNPSYLFEEITSVREDQLPYLWHGQSLTTSGNYRAEYSTLAGCDSIYTLQFTVTALPIYTVTVEADHGHVNGTGTYPEGTNIHLLAVPDPGFEFSMWSDIETNNPKNFTVMQDTVFRAHFFMTEVEQEVTVDSIQTHSVTITWDTVAGAILYELCIYQNGRLIATFHVDNNNTILDAIFTGMERIVARKDTASCSTETLQVHVAGLAPGQDYTYSLDSYDDDRSYVGARSGSFTTMPEQTTTQVLSTAGDNTPALPRKELYNGQLYIVLPDGTRYTASGQVIQ